jgi:hypothetical protein
MCQPLSVLPSQSGENLSAATVASVVIPSRKVTSVFMSGFDALEPQAFSAAELLVY